MSNVLNVSIANTQNSTYFWSDAEETIPLLYTGEYARVDVTVSPQGADLSGETLDVYVAFTNIDASMTLASGTHTYTMTGSDGSSHDVEVIVTHIGGWPDTYKISINGDDLSSGTLVFNFNTLFASPSSSGGSMYIWAEYDETNALRVDWRTKADEYILKKTSKSNASFVADEDNICLSSLCYTFYLSRDTTAEYLEVGKDYLSSVDFTDILELPDELIWRDGLIDAIRNGNWYTNVSSKGMSYVYVTINESDYLFCSINTPNYSGQNGSLYSCGVYITDDSKIALVCTYKTSSTTKDWSMSEVGLTFGNSVILVKDPGAEATSSSIDIINNLTAEEHFYYSEDQIDTASAVTTLSWGTPDLSLSKTSMFSTTTVHYLGGKIDYTVTAKNTTAFPYTNLRYLYDEPSQYLYIKPDDMQDMFSDDSEDHTLTIQLKNATLTGTSSKTVTNINGDTVNLDQQYVQESGTDYSGKETTDSSWITSSATITITWQDDVTDTLVMIVSCDGSEQTYTIGVGCDYDSIGTALSSIGYIVTYNVQYTMTWDLGEDYILRGGQSIVKSYIMTVKNSFMLLIGDQDWYIVDNSVYTKNVRTNYIYAKDANFNNLKYANISSTFTLYRDFVLDKSDTEVQRYSSDTQDYEPVDDGTIIYDDVISYQTTVTNYAWNSNTSSSKNNANYNAIPLVDKMTGGQVLLVRSDDNPDLSGFETVTIDGTIYYILDQEGTYSNIVIDSEGRIADTVTVTKQADGSIVTMIYLYLTISGVQTLTFDYMSIVRPVNADLDENYSFTLSNEAWLNDHETHRLYDAAFKGGSILKVNKYIVASGANNDNPSDDTLESRTTLSEGETVTYRLTLNASGPALLNGSNIYDVLPETVSGNAWTESDITVRVITDDADVSFDTLSAWESGWYITGKNPDEPSLGISDPETQQYLMWDDSLSITWEGMLYIYVSVTYPDGNNWTDYVDTYSDLKNTLHVMQLYDTVYHDMPLVPSVYLQKGVASIQEIYGSLYGTKYNGLYCVTCEYRSVIPEWSFESNFEYLNRSSHNASLITYYTVLYNDGRTNLYLSDLYDVLPDGFYHIGYSYLSNDKTYTSLTNCITSGLTIYDSEGNTIDDIVFKSCDIESSYNTSDNIITFSLSGGDLSEQSGTYYLAPGEAVAFQYCTMPQYYSDTEDTALNSIAMPYADNTGTGIKVADVNSVYMTSVEPNEGTCSMEGAAYAETLGLSGGSDIWLVSDVTVYRESIIPNIVKSTEQVTATDAEDISWDIMVTNTGNATMAGYTILDVMQSPYDFMGTVSYNLGCQISQQSYSSSSYDLFTITSVTDTTMAVSYANSSAKIYLNGDPVQISSVIVEWYVDGNGNYVLSIYFNGTTYALQPGCSGTLTLTTSPDSNHHENKVYYNTAYVVPDQAFDEYSIISGTYVDETTDDHVDSQAVKYTAATAVSYGYATTSRKLVTETNDDANTAASDGTTTYILLDDTADEFYYTLEVINGDSGNNGKDMDQLVIIDTLPEQGDTDVYGLNDRNSVFTVELADDPDFNARVSYTDTNGVQTLNLAEGTDYTVEYSTEKNFTTDDWNGVADASKWTAVFDGARSFRVVFNFGGSSSTYIPAGATVYVTFKAVIPGGQEIEPGSIAWNSFGYSVSVEDSADVLQAGTLNVGVRVPGYPMLQKAVDEALQEDKTFRFVIYETASVTGNDLISALDAAGIVYTIAEVTLNAGDTLSDTVSLKDACVYENGVETSTAWTWTEGASYTVAELEDDADTVFASWNTTTAANKYTFTYTSARNQRLKCQNKVSKGSVMLTKVDSEDNTVLLPDAVFTIYSNAVCTDADIVGTMVTNDKGVATYSGLNLGTYYVKETQAPVGYKMDDSTVYEVSITEDGETALVNATSIVTNVHAAGTLILTKTDADDGSVLADVVFTLSNDGTTIKFMKNSDGIYEVDDDGSTTELITDADGQIQVTGLLFGDYVLTEIKAAVGYMLDHTEYAFTIDENDFNVSTGEAIPEEISVTNEKTYELPKTGSYGILWGSLLGILLMIFAVWFKEESINNKHKFQKRID